jgi:hypothetical protein
MVDDPVFWWYEKQKSDKRLEPLVQMGMDILSIPGESRFYCSNLFLFAHSNLHISCVMPDGAIFQQVRPHGHTEERKPQDGDCPI